MIMKRLWEDWQGGKLRGMITMDDGRAKDRLEHGWDLRPAGIPLWNKLSRSDQLIALTAAIEVLDILEDQDQDRKE